MIETGNFSAEDLLEVIEEVKGFRGLEDLIIKGEITYDVPIQRPTKIICMARNYRKHAEEFNSEVPTSPKVFLKSTAALLPNEGAIRIPHDIGRVDHEIELAVIIGETATQVSEEEAMKHVAGYTIANDVTARSLQKEAKDKGEPWTLCKGMDTFLPIGPYVVPADAIDDPHNLNIELTVGDETRQKSNTSYMLFSIPTIISYVSQYITLMPGDIICTGTPEGVGPIKSGDLVQCKIEGLGVLRNTAI